MKPFAAFALAAVLLTAASTARAAPAEPVQVMVVGVFHMSNPGQDIANMESPDPTTPRRQAEITRVIEGLNRFHPTAIATEWDAATVTVRLAGFGGAPARRPIGGLLAISVAFKATSSFSPSFESTACR